MSEHIIDSIEALEAIYNNPSEASLVKESATITDEYRRLIEVSPFVALASVGAEGVDCSPRGDLKGFVRIHDEKTVMIPDRRGNNRLDSMSNIIANPNVGLLFLIPGVGETLRINGKARVVRDETMLETMAVNGKAPTAAILVEVEEAFLHCAKAIRRSQLWDQDAQIDRTELPGVGRMVNDMAKLNADPDKADASYDAAVAKLYE